MKKKKIAALGLSMALITIGLTACGGEVPTTTGTESSSIPTTLSGELTQSQHAATSSPGVTSSTETQQGSSSSAGGGNQASVDYFAIASNSGLVEDYQGLQDLKPYQTLGGAEQAGAVDYKLPFLNVDSPDAVTFNEVMERWSQTIRLTHQDTAARHETVFQNRYTTIESGNTVSILVKRITQYDDGLRSEWAGAYVFDKMKNRFLNFREILEVAGIRDLSAFVAKIEDELMSEKLVTDQYPYDDGIGTKNLKMLNYDVLTYVWALCYQPEGLNPWFYMDADEMRAGLLVEGEGMYMPPVSVFLDAEGELCIIGTKYRIVTQKPGEEMRPARLAREMKIWRYVDSEGKDGGVYDLAYQNACKLAGIENPLDGPEAFVVYLGDQVSREPYARTQWVVDLAGNYDKHYIFDVNKSIYYPDQEYYAVIPKNKKMGVVVMGQDKGFVGLSTVGSTIVGVEKGQRLGLWYRDRLTQFELKHDGTRMLIDPNLPVIDLSDQIPKDQTADDEMMDFLRLFNLGVG